MAHYALINENNTVTQVIVGLDGGGTDWESYYSEVFNSTCIQTSYNTHGNTHSLGGIPLRKNYAGIGYFYDKNLDAFIPPKPFFSWVLNEETGLWEPPVAPPKGVVPHKWSEDTLMWVPVPKPESPSPSWVFDEDSWSWMPPSSAPNDGKEYVWDVKQDTWVELTDELRADFDKRLALQLENNQV